MKIKNALPKLLVVLGAIIMMASCEEEIGTIGSEIIGDQDVNTTLDISKTIRSYSRKLLPVQTNGLETNQFGIYNDPAFGMSKINMLSQVVLEDPNPEFNFLPVLDSVVLYIPFYSEAEIEDGGTETETTTYTLDSIYGNTTMNISMYESTYFLRDFDPTTGFEETQNYYSDQNQLFQNFKGPLIHTIENFLPSNESYIEVTTAIDDDDGEDDGLTKTVLAPGIRVQLPTAYFKEKILEQEGTSNLLNNNNFREYFRGIFFEVDGTDTNLIKFDMTEAKIDLYYTSEFNQPDFDTPIENIGDTIMRDEKRLTLLFDAINVNVFDNQLNPQISDAIANPDFQNGEERLYVRGGDGIISIIELFGDDNDGNGVADELDEIRQNKWLINEANLIFYVDKDALTGGDEEPERLIIYDIINNTALIDYALDTTSGEEPEDAYNIHLGKLERGTDGNGDFYKIRITNHLSNLIHQDSTNVALGVITSQNVVLPGFQDVINIQAPGLDQVPESSVISHEGTVLFGNRAVNEERRLKLQIYYTESN
jgi:hypothetical protein